eukprot:5344116-Prymnesium_polylepis.1
MKPTRLAPVDPDEAARVDVDEPDNTRMMRRRVVQALRPESLRAQSVFTSIVFIVITYITWPNAATHPAAPVVMPAAVVTPAPLPPLPPPGVVARLNVNPVGQPSNKSLEETTLI